MAEEHDLQSNRMVDEQIRSVALDADGRWLACMCRLSTCNVGVPTDRTPWDREERAPAQHRLDLLSLPSACDAERGLIAHVAAQVPDPRRLKPYSWRCILAGLLGGVLAGKQTMRDIAAWARSLPEEAIVRLVCRPRHQ